MKLYQHNTRLQHTYQGLICCSHTQHKCQQPTKAAIRYYIACMDNASLHSLLCSPLRHRASGLLCTCRKQPHLLASLRASSLRSARGTACYSAHHNICADCFPGQHRLRARPDASSLRADDNRCRHVSPAGRRRPRADRGRGQRSRRRLAAGPSRARQAPTTLAHTGTHGQRYMSSWCRSCIGPRAALA